MTEETDFTAYRSLTKPSHVTLEQFHSILEQIDGDLIGTGARSERPTDPGKDVLWYDSVHDVLERYDVGTGRWIGGPGATRRVGVGRFDSIQDAYDDLPESGGTIYLEDTIAETDIVFEEGKVCRLIGQGTIFDRDWPVQLDTSGGDGVHLQGRGHVLRDLHIEGDGTGGYGIRVGDDTGFSGRYFLDNVSVRGKGGPGIHYIGRQINSYYDVVVHECGKGHYIDMAVGDWYLGEVTWRRMGAHSCDNQGIHIVGPGTLIGNTITQIWSELNEGPALEITVNQFQGNQISGYGMESSETIITPNDTTHPEGSKWNTLNTRRSGWPLTVDYRAFTRFETREVGYLEGVGLIASPRNSLKWLGGQANEWDIDTIRIPEGTWGKIEPYPDQTYIGESKGGVRIESDETNGIGFNNNDAAGATVRNLTIAAPSSGDAIYSNGAATDVTVEDVVIEENPGGYGIQIFGANSIISNARVGAAGEDEIRIDGDDSVVYGCIVAGNINVTGSNINADTNV